MLLRRHSCYHVHQRFKRLSSYKRFQIRGSLRRGKEICCITMWSMLPRGEEIGVSLYRSTSLPNIFCVLTILPPRKLWFSSPSSAPLSTGSRGYHPPSEHRRSSIMTGCNLPLRQGKCKNTAKYKKCALEQRIHPHLGNNLWAPSPLPSSFIVGWAPPPRTPIYFGAHGSTGLPYGAVCTSGELS